MKISDLAAMCLRNLLRRKFRTFLTVIGVVIGTCAIVVMISLGVGISASQEAMLNSWGDLTVIEVWGSSTGDNLLDDEAVEAFQTIPGVDVATPFMTYYPDNGGSSLYQGKRDRYVYWNDIVGVYPEAMEKLGYTLAEGEMFQGGAKTIQMVFGSNAAYYFFNAKNYDRRYQWPDEYGNIQDPFFQPLESEFSVQYTYWDDKGERTTKFAAEAVGILSEDISDYQTTYTIYVHLDDLKRMKAEYEKENGIKKSRDEKDEYNTVKVKAESVKVVGEVYETISAMGYEAWSMESEREMMEEQTRQIQMILGMMGGVSLFVAAISITNTMIMSVYERTREIGVMKVLGCLVSDIRSIFLMEAGLIGFIGGIVGIGMSYLLSWLLNRFGSSLGSVLGGFSIEGMDVSIIPPWLVALGLTFATLIGLISGFQPANRAVRISALEAIKTE